MPNFFRNFPIVNYSFGGLPDTVLFENITAYIKIIDDIKDNVAFYETTFIDDFERPDTLSFKLYGTVNYYWTFYYLNNDIRESGWPLAELELQNKLKSDYPHRTIVTQNDISKKFKVGDTVEGQTSGTTGTVVKRFIDLGQIVVKTSDNFSVGELVIPNNSISDTITVASLSLIHI